MNQLEQELVNIGSLVAGTAATLVSANNPAYSSLISLANGLVQEINAKVNPSTAGAVANLSVATAAAVQPVTSAIKTVGSADAAAPAKVSAISTLISEVEVIGGGLLHIFHTTPAPVAAPAAA